MSDYSITFDDIKKLHGQGSLRDIDYYLAEMLSRRFEGTAAEVLLTAALASHNLADNHICFDLDQAAGKKWPEVEDKEKYLHQITLPKKDTWEKLLLKSPIFSMESESKKSVLVGFGSRIYLRRYFDYEKNVADKLIGFTKTDSDCADNLSLSEEECSELLEILFPGDQNISNEKQIAAAEVILKGKLLILSGGPGTGKTYTLARLTAMLVTAFKKSFGRLPDIKMAAPTGKAAMRMSESIRDAKESIRSAVPTANRSEIADILAGCIDDIPDNSGTIHRLPGIINSTKFRHNAEHPLSADILIIDEASMVDLSMMAKILDALQENTKLILLGDMHQINSVNPGYVLGDICKAAQDNAGSGLGKSLVELTYSRRFTPGSPVDLLSSALHTAGDNNDPDGINAWNMLLKLSSESEDNDGVNRHKTPQTLHDANGTPLHDFREIVMDNYKPLLKAKNVQEAFEAISRFRILSPLGKGPHGVLAINRLVEETLSYKNIKRDNLDFIPLDPAGEFYDRRMIMVRRNDYGLKLFNGDIGIVMDEDADGAVDGISAPPKKTVWFESTNEENGEKSYRSFSCNMIPEHETAFAMTIHKSQGSEYKKVMVVMPYRDNEKHFTKELLYTAITRAKEEVNIWCNEDVFKNTACRKAECSSGLSERLKF